MYNFSTPRGCTKNVYQNVKMTSCCFVFQPLCLNTTQVQSYQDESYVPMASPSPSVATIECDGYIPMSPMKFSFLNPNCNDEAPATFSRLMGQPGDLAPPPIHRHLKPRLRRGVCHNSPDWFMLHLFWHCVENTSPPPGCAKEMSVQDSRRYQIHIFFFPHNHLCYASPFESWPFRCTLQNYNRSSNFVLFWVHSSTSTSWLERPLYNHRVPHSSSFEQSNDWIMVRGKKSLFIHKV